ncbi:MAG TPA: 2TM domain-containing protein [Saprospiraceae bacterium]|nr:2TM domain-containing protein [Saprospiraceae bacterium]HMP24517.1 2TM domain-containing protein [Saprospiraceae bacterium]
MQQRPYHTRNDQDDQYLQQYKFQKHLRAYLIVVGTISMLQFFSKGIITPPAFAFWWGIGLAIHYLNVFGWDKLPIDQKAPPRNESSREDDADLLVELKKQPRRAWRERDLV